MFARWGRSRSDVAFGLATLLCASAPTIAGDRGTLVAHAPAHEGASGLTRDCADCPPVERRTLEGEETTLKMTHETWYYPGNPAPIDYTEDVVDFLIEAPFAFFAHLSSSEGHDVMVPASRRLHRDVFVSDLVSGRDWEACANAKECLPISADERGLKASAAQSGPSAPIHVTYAQAATYQAFVRSRSGRDFHLPSLDELLLLDERSEAGREPTEICSGLFQEKGSWELSGTCVDANCKAVWAYRAEDDRCVPMRVSLQSDSLAFRLLRPAAEKK